MTIWINSNLSDVALHHGGAFCPHGCTTFKPYGGLFGHVIVCYGQRHRHPRRWWMVLFRSRGCCLLSEQRHRPITVLRPYGPMVDGSFGVDNMDSNLFWFENHVRTFLDSSDSCVLFVNNPRNVLFGGKPSKGKGLFIQSCRL